MQKFVRGNYIVCSATFQPLSGSGEATGAEAVLVYTNDAGDEETEVIHLTEADGSWAGVFDSSVCKDATEQTVDWVIKSTGGVVAATQGSFKVLANRANIDDAE